MEESKVRYPGGGTGKILTPPKRVVEILNEDVDGVTVRIRNYFEPIHLRLWEIAKQTMEMYQSDITHDALQLAFANEGDKFLWGYRPTGTNLIALTGRINVSNTLSIIAAMTNPLENWHLLEIKKMRKYGEADGYVTWINAKDVEQLKKVIEDNLPSS